jgi:hypothetical protein
MYYVFAVGLHCFRLAFFYSVILTLDEVKISQNLLFRDMLNGLSVFIYI